MANAFYGQSGGVTAVINATAAGIIEAAKSFPDKIQKVYAGQNGILGALNEDLIDITAESPETLAALMHTPGGAFGTCRLQLGSPNVDHTQYQRLIDVFRAHDIRYFFYNGGGDSQDTTAKLAHAAELVGYDLTCIGVPKTIDNDLPRTDCCPGFGSAAKFVALSALEASFDVASMHQTSTKVFVMEVMGRHTGWLAAASGLACDERGLGPDVILVPEIVFNRDKFLARIDQAVQNKGFCIVIAAEGIRDQSGDFLSSMGTADAFGHAQLGGVAPRLVDIIKQAKGYKCHWAVCDYLQRAARHIASQVDVDQAFAVGKAAVNYAMQGLQAVMPAIVRTQSAPYLWHLEPVHISEVAGGERYMPREFMTEEGLMLSRLGREYFAPLIDGEAYPPYRHGLPEYQRCRNKTIQRKLPEYQPPEHLTPEHLTTEYQAEGDTVLVRKTA